VEGRGFIGYSPETLSCLKYAHPGAFGDRLFWFAGGCQPGGRGGNWLNVLTGGDSVWCSVGYFDIFLGLMPYIGALIAGIPPVPLVIAQGWLVLALVVGLMVLINTICEISSHR
jgi:hypothetical protein